MTAFEIVNIVIAFSSLGVAGLALFKASNVSARAAMAQVEMMIEDRIARSTHLWLGSMEKVAIATVKQNTSEATEVDDVRKTAADVELTVVKEIYCNAVESACALYLDGKTDQDRFKKSYTDMIRSHVASEDFAELYNRNTTRYMSTLKCSDDFNPGREK